MPTLTRQPDDPIITMPRGIATGRGGDGTAVGAPVSPPEVLLPSGGPDPIETWSRPRPEHRRTHPGDAFEGHVRAIHRQLMPLRSRAALASSYRREAGPSSPGSDALEPLRLAPALQVAYALRWLELADAASTAAEDVDRSIPRED